TPVETSVCLAPRRCDTRQGRDSAIRARFHAGHRGEKIIASLHLRAKVIVGGGLRILCLILPGSARAGGAFICPNKDLAGRSLADQSFGTTIFCSYGNGF